MITDIQELKFTHPIFWVADGVVSQVNQAAASRMIEAGMHVSDLICIGKEEYSRFTEGKLCLTLRVNQLDYSACVVKTEEHEIFHLDTGYAEPELRALALAAKYLRGPLANAMTCADQLDGSQALSRFLHQIHRAVRNMSDAADYTATNTVNKEMRDITAFMAQLMEKAAALMEKAGRTVLYTGPANSLLCAVDADRLERAVMNLLSNGAKFTPQGSPIHVSLSHKGTKLYLSVESENARIPDSVRSDLFCRYQREPGLEDGRFGIGLGLTMVRSAAAAHNGTVLLTPSNKGVRFTMTLSTSHKSDIVRSPVKFPHVDCTGGYDSALVELSEVLPPELYK